MNKEVEKTTFERLHKINVKDKTKKKNGLTYCKNRERDDKGKFKVIHGDRKTRLYSTWCNIKSRCYNIHNKRYNRYGGRNISVCNEWKDSFKNFKDWAMANGYKEDLTIDRIDNDKGYCPENCRWATRSQQNKNYSRNHTITYRGETKCILDWANCFGINRATILYRLNAGKKLDEVFSKTDGRTTRWKKATSLN